MNAIAHLPRLVGRAEENLLQKNGWGVVGVGGIPKNSPAASANEGFWSRVDMGAGVG